MLFVTIALVQPWLWGLAARSSWGEDRKTPSQVSPSPVNPSQVNQQEPKRIEIAQKGTSKISAPKGSHDPVMKAFMTVKLTQSQAILEGLTTEDFEMVERNASAMFLLTKGEQWKASKDAKFLQQSSEFERLTTQLAKSAQEKNLDGATLTYLQLTLNCVDCHRFVRNKVRTPEGTPANDEK